MDRRLKKVCVQTLISPYYYFFFLNNRPHSGLRVPALLLCSPDNPTGRIFSEQELRAVFEWAREKRIHLISDEVYAASTYGGKFTSILNVIDDGKLHL